MFPSQSGSFALFVLSFASHVHSQPLLLHTCVLRLPKQLAVHKPEQLSTSIYKVRVWGGRKMPSKSPQAGQSSTTAQDTTDVTLQVSNCRSSVAFGCPTYSRHWRQGPPAEQGHSGSVLSGLSQGQERL